MDRIPIARPRLHSMQRGKKVAVHAGVALDLSVVGFKPSGVDHSWLETD